MRDLTSFPYSKFMKTTLYFIQEDTVELGLGQSHGKYTTAPLAHGYSIGHGKSREKHNCHKSRYPYILKIQICTILSVIVVFFIIEEPV